MVIIFEGISGAGKSTQAGMLHQQLRDTLHSSVLGEFSPGSIGGLIEQTYRRKRRRFVSFHGKERFADQTHLILLADIIAKAEEAYQSSAGALLIDRFFDSWFCYALAEPHRLALHEHLLRDLYQSCLRTHVPANAITIFLEIDVETAIHRLMNRDGFGISEEECKRLRAIAHNFEDLYARHPVVRVRGDDTPQGVTTSILEVLEPQIRNMRSNFLK